jgi:hypothetical protein
MTTFMDLMILATYHKNGAGREIPKEDWDNELLGVSEEDTMTIVKGILASE